MSIARPPTGGGQRGTTIAGPPPNTTQRRPYLLIVVVIVAVIAGGFLLLRARTNSAGPSKHGKQVAAVVKKSHSRDSATKAKVTKHVKHHAKLPANVRYAKSILLLLDRSTNLFNRTRTATAAAGGLDQLNSVCGNFSSQVALAADQFDGVPHPGTWYGPVGKLHHQIMGVYHNMAGALQQCQNAFDSGDTGAAALAQSDIAQAAQQMYSYDAGTRRLAHQVGGRGGTA